MGEDRGGGGISSGGIGIDHQIEMMIGLQHHSQEKISPKRSGCRKGWEANIRLQGWNVVRQNRIVISSLDGPSCRASVVFSNVASEKPWL